MPSYKLTYFHVKARAEPIKYAFHIGGIPFTDEKLDWANWCSGQIKKEDFSLFGQLPVLTIDGVMLADTLAILRYVGRLVGLYPDDPLEAAKVDMMFGVAEDISQAIMGFCVEKDATRKEEIRQTLAKEKLPKMFDYLERYLSSNGSAAGYCVGEKLTVADLHMYSVLGWGKKYVSDDIINNYLGICRVYENVDRNEKVADWNKTHVYMY